MNDINQVCKNQVSPLLFKLSHLSSHRVDLLTNICTISWKGNIFFKGRISSAPVCLLALTWFCIFNIDYYMSFITETK